MTVAGRQAKAMADQLMTASKLRFLDRVGTISPAEMEDIARAIRVPLDL